MPNLQPLLKRKKECKEQKIIGFCIKHFLCHQSYHVESIQKLESVYLLPEVKSKISWNEI